MRFRGRSNLISTLETLLINSTFGLKNASEVILSGGSDGGIAVYANIDFVSEYLKKAIPKVHVIGFPDTGLFLDGTDFEISKDWWKQT